MFKKVLFTLISILFLGGYAIAGNADSESPRRDASGIIGDGQYRNTYIHRVTSSGHIVNETGAGELGSPTYPWKYIHSSTGMSRFNELFLDLPAKDHDIVLAGNAISTSTLVSAGTTYIAMDLTQPSVPRNVVFLTTTVTNVGQTTITVRGQVYISGFDSVGRATFTYQNVVSTSNASAGLGDIAWSYISSITILPNALTFGGTPEATLKIFIGTGDKIGLANDIASTGDIYHVSEAGTVTRTYIANATYNTIDFATDGNGTNDYVVRYIQKYFTELP